MKSIFIFFSVFLTCMASEVSGQFHLGTYGFAAVGIGGPITDRIDIEGKLFANSTVGNLGFEFLGMYDLEPGSFHQFSVGGGFNFDLLDPGDSQVSLLLPFELEVYPLASFRRLSLLIELAPQFYITEDQVVLRHLWGVRYYFKDPS